MIMYLIRHAIAEQRDSGSEQEDSHRPLTDEGRKKMRKIAQGLKELGLQIDLVLTSPYLRAADTARIVAKKFDLARDKLIQVDDLSPVGQADRLVNEISKKYGQVENIALVGHEPSLSQLISMLLSGDPTLPIDLKKGGVCRLSVEVLQYGRCATLEWLLAPAQLAEIGG
jgi:phosphohistidine phosphatase